MAELRSKRQFFDLWAEGLLGNRPPLFRTLKEALASGLPAIGFRELGKAGGGDWRLAIGAGEIEMTHYTWTLMGRTFIMDGAVPNCRAMMQGEICTTTEGLVSFLCVREQVAAQHLLTTPGLPPMRQTIAKGWHYHRGPLETRLLICQYMDPSSRDDIEALFERYPDAAIEFACFSVNTGVLPRRNTIIWEVRNY